MLKIVLLGYGSMGKEVHRLAQECGCEVVAVYDIDRPLTKNSYVDFDVAIDFTEPSVVVDNAKYICDLGKDLVIGTTGWYDNIQRIETLQRSAINGIIHGSNFSVGVQVFFRLVRAAGILINDLSEYDVMIHEWHHKRKKDSPSGTALNAAAILLDEIQRKHSINSETSHQTIDAADLHVTSSRGGEVVGTHTLLIDGTSDSIEIKHSAKNRSGFARGALMAARWIRGKHGFFDFTDVYTQIISEGR